MSYTPLHPSYLEMLPPQSCRHPWNWPGRFVSACMRAVFCTAPVEHVWALPLIGRPTSSTDNRMKNSSTITHGRSSPSVCQEDGIGSRYQVSEREVRMASAWNIRSKPPRQCLVTLQPVFFLWVNTGMTVQLTLGDFSAIFYNWIYEFDCFLMTVYTRGASACMQLSSKNNFLWNDTIFVNSHLLWGQIVDFVAFYRYSIFPISSQGCNVRAMFSLFDRVPDGRPPCGVKSKQERWCNTWFYSCVFKWNAR